MSEDGREVVHKETNCYWASGNREESAENFWPHLYYKTDILWPSIELHPMKCKGVQRWSWNIYFTCCKGECQLNLCQTADTQTFSGAKQGFNVIYTIQTQFCHIISSYHTAVLSLRKPLLLPSPVNHSIHIYEDHTALCPPQTSGRNPISVIDVLRC